MASVRNPVLLTVLLTVLFAAASVQAEEGVPLTALPSVAPAPVSPPVVESPPIAAPPAVGNAPVPVEPSMPEPSASPDLGSPSRGVELHFFGNRTGVVSPNGNAYAGMTVGGKLDLGLAFSATPSENLRLAGQLFIDVDHVNLIGVDRVETSVDYTFAEIRHSDAFRFLFGFVRVPGGWYSDVLNVGTARPFNLLPLSVYGPSGLLGRTYRGAGMKGLVPLNDAWTFDYHLYAGPTNTIDDRSTFEVQRAGWTPPVSSADAILKKFNADAGNAGFRANFEWSEGLSLALAGELRLSEEKRFAAGYVDGYLGVQLQYLRDAFSLRTEAFHLSVAGLKNELAAYAELSADVLPWLGLAARIDYDRILPAAGVLATTRAGLLEHTDLAAAITYSYSPQFRIRVDYHYILGNRFVYDRTALLTTGAAATMPGSSSVLLIGFSLGI